MREAATETAFIVHLSVVRQPDRLPDVNQEGLGIAGPAAWGGLSGGIAGDDIDRIETRGRFPATEVVRDNIDLAQLPRGCRLQPRIGHLNRDVRRAPRMRHPGGSQHPFDARGAGQRRNLLIRQTRANGGATDVRQFGLVRGGRFQFTARLADARPHVLR